MCCRRVVQFCPALDAYAHRIPLVNPGDEGKAVTVYWYSPPEVFVVEWILTHVILLPLLLFAARTPRTWAVSARKQSASRKKTWRELVLWTVDSVCTLILIASELWCASTRAALYGDLNQPVSQMAL